MAWVGNSRCLYCQEKLPLYRLLAAEDFCSAAHREAFLQDQTRLGLERLVGARLELDRMFGTVLQPDPVTGDTPEVRSTAPVDYGTNARVAYPSMPAHSLPEPASFAQPGLGGEPKELAGFAEDLIVPADYWRFRMPEPIAFPVRMWFDIPFTIGLLGEVAIAEAMDEASDNDEERPPLAGPLPLRLEASRGDGPSIVAGQPAEYDLDTRIAYPDFARDSRVCSATERGLDVSGIAAPTGSTDWMPAGCDLPQMARGADFRAFPVDYDLDTCVAYPDFARDAQAWSVTERGLDISGIVALTGSTDWMPAGCDVPRMPRGAGFRAFPVDYDLDTCIAYPDFARDAQAWSVTERGLEISGIAALTGSTDWMPAGYELPRMARGGGYRAFPRGPEPLTFPSTPGLSISFVQRPLRDLDWLTSPETTAEPAEDEVPCMELLQLERPAQVDRGPRRVSRMGEPIPLRSRTWIAMETSATEARMQESGLRSLPLDEVPLVHGIWVNELDVVEVEEYEALIPAMDTPMPNPRLRFGVRAPLQPELVRGARTAVAEYDPYPIRGQVAMPEANFVVRVLTITASSGQLPIQPDWQGATRDSVAAGAVRHTDSGPLPLPSKPMMASAAGSGSGDARRPSPKPGRMVSLKWQGTPKPSKIVTSKVVAPAAYTNAPMQPKSRLSPMSLTERWTGGTVGKSLSTPSLAPMTRFWQYAPKDLRLLAMLVPLLVILALRPSIPKVSISQSKSASQFSAVMSQQWRNVKHTISDRAGIDLADDFRTGLDNWTSRGDSTAAWSYDRTGFVRPGPLALYQPSMNLRDYDVELLTEIQTKSLGVAVRAGNFDRYQAVRLSILQSGPMPKVAVIHYPVIGGKEGPRTVVPLPFDVRTDTLYHLRIEAHGEDFTVHVQDKLVAFWSDNRFRSGGVGLFCSKGEDARVRWIEVMHQYDALGRLCAYLAPYGMQTSNGSWTQQ